MTAAAAAFAYAATIAFAGFWLWLRDRSRPTMAERMADLERRHKLLGDAFSELSVRAAETRSIVDNLQLRSGLTSKR